MNTVSTVDSLTNCGDAMPHVLPEVKSADAQLTGAVLSHIARYRLSIFSAIERLPEFSPYGLRQVKETLRDCRRHGLLGCAPLHHGAAYWYLDARGAAHCGVPEERVGPLSEPAKLRALAMLRFCCLSDRPRQRISAEELTHTFKCLARPGLPSGYYFDPAGSGRLGLARVDAARRGRWDRVVQSLREDMKDHMQQPGFRQLVQAGRFEITLLTIFRQKARRVYDSLSEVRRGCPVPIEVVAIPELLPLVTSAR